MRMWGLSQLQWLGRNWSCAEDSSSLAENDNNHPIASYLVHNLHSRAIICHHRLPDTCYVSMWCHPLSSYTRRDRSFTWAPSLCTHNSCQRWHEHHQEWWAQFISSKNCIQVMPPPDGARFAWQRSDTLRGVDWIGYLEANLRQKEGIKK